MADELKDGTFDLSDEDGIELSDEALESITGGFIYHDEGDPQMHRKEAFYVLDSGGQIVMKVDSMERAEHWAGNLRTSLTPISAEEFGKMRGL